MKPDLPIVIHTTDKKKRKAIAQCNGRLSKAYRLYRNNPEKHEEHLRVAEAICERWKDEDMFTILHRNYINNRT